MSLGWNPRRRAHLDVRPDAAGALKVVSRLCHDAPGEAPPGIVVRILPRGWCDTAGVVAVTCHVVSWFVASDVVAGVVGDDDVFLAWQFVPWLVGLPFLRRVSMSPSQWLVLSLLCPMSLILLHRLATRRLAPGPVPVGVATCLDRRLPHGPAAPACCVTPTARG